MEATEAPTRRPTLAPLPDVPAPTPAPVSGGSSGSTDTYAEGSCVFCDNADAVRDADLVLDGVACVDWERMARSNEAGSDECLLLRASAVAKCGCPYQFRDEETGEEDGETIVILSAFEADSVSGSVAIIVDGKTVPTCPLCIIEDPENTSPQLGMVEAAKELPNSIITCGEVLKFPAVDGDETCRVLQETYGHWCGCPNSEPPCSLCDNGEDPSRSGIKFHINSNDPTCQDMADTLETVLKPRCAGYKSGLEQAVGYDIHKFCGCSIDSGSTSTGAEDGGTCKACPDGYELMNEESGSSLAGMGVPSKGGTCADWVFRSTFVTNKTLCTNIQNTALGPNCCEEVESVEDADRTIDSVENEAESGAKLRKFSGLIVPLVGVSSMLFLMQCL